MKANPGWKIKSIKETVRLEMFADVHVSKIKKAKAIVRRRVREAMHEEYARVFDYQLEILRSNPGSTVAVVLNPKESAPVFQRLYVCFHACKRGFIEGCRKVVGLDGCFFKGAQSGELLCALGRDANGQMYPIAWAAVEVENKDSWFWFMALLNKDLEIENQGEGWVFISDQQKGLINAVSKVVSNAEHRNCARHIYANWKKKHRDQAYQKRFWACAKSSNRIHFNLNRAKLAQLTPDGARDMMQSGPEHWCRAWFKEGSCCDSVDNNMCESFNNWIVEYRGLPIISMFEAIRAKVTKRIQVNRAMPAKWNGTICPKIMKKVNKLIQLTEKCETIWNGKDGYEVKLGKHGFKVDMEAKICSCRYWQLSGIPCVHALAASQCGPDDIVSLIASCYTIEAYNRTYEHCLMPMEGMPSWPVSDRPRPAVPGYVQMPGRPRTERRRGADEPPKHPHKLSKIGRKGKCSLCGQPGHNMRKCTSNPNRGKYKNKKRKKETKQNEPRTSQRVTKGTSTGDRAQSSQQGTQQHSSHQGTQHQSSQQGTQTKPTSGRAPKQVNKTAPKDKMCKRPGATSRQRRTVSMFDELRS
ncbi:uncharacterized protein [Aegilops tauschii subsp. strangulata]|uniref:SWIM-type domain-containing protein n=1 Tax=Aegilops tauschii subsp. strangulata TaxID=200361 RepID=A0A452XN59_AEGTS|nr:uncharacterized protein LOC120962791 isoform X1 [Aegilops tauschii subsp. strangulata]